MNTFDNIRQTPKRFRQYTDRLSDLMKMHKIKSIKDLISSYRKNNDFRKQWSRIWEDLAKAEGGKLSLTTIGVVMGASLGGVGIAALGGAVGLPLFAVLGLAGLAGGSKFDASGYFSNNKITMLKIPKVLYRQIEEAAKNSSLSPNELMIMILEESFAAKIKKIENGKEEI
ncbi:MAG: bacteriocin class II family protein [Desulfococcaceae bacterium]|jgi:hypothetical protein|nr:bacteriocin class II family protein [Desulfococcaceae bacterium]